jgi:hypothetical protein
MDQGHYVGTEVLQLGIYIHRGWPTSSIPGVTRYATRYMMAPTLWR